MLLPQTNATGMERSKNRVSRCSTAISVFWEIFLNIYITWNWLTLTVLWMNDKEDNCYVRSEWSWKWDTYNSWPALNRSMLCGTLCISKEKHSSFTQMVTNTGWGVGGGRGVAGGEGGGHTVSGGHGAIGGTVILNGAATTIPHFENHGIHWRSLRPAIHNLQHLSWIAVQ